MSLRAATERWKRRTGAVMLTVAALTAYPSVRHNVLPVSACRFIDSYSKAPSDFGFFSKIALSLTLSRTEQPDQTRARI